VLINSARVPLNSSRTRSCTASELSRNSAEVPGVTFSRTLLMKSLLIPTSDSEPNRAPEQGPGCRPAPRGGVQLAGLGLPAPCLPAHHGGVLHRDQLLGVQLWISQHHRAPSGIVITRRE
jgi:hypothetical protein